MQVRLGKSTGPRPRQHRVSTFDARMPGVAFVRERKRNDGTSYFSVTYRMGGRGSRQSSTSFPEQKQADRFSALVGAYGPERALQLVGIPDTPQGNGAASLTVAEFLGRHIDDLSGVERKTLTEYRRYVRNDIGPALGALPLGKLTRADVAGWSTPCRRPEPRRAPCRTSTGSCPGR